MVFDSSIVEKDGHGILYCDGIDIFKGVFNVGHRHFEVSFK